LDPEREAKKIIDRAVDHSSRVHVFYGFGYGYHLEEYLYRFSDRQLVVIEKHASILLSAMKQRDLSKLFADQRLHIFLHPKLEELHAQLAPFARKKITAIRLEQFTHTDEEYYADVHRVLQELSSRREVNMATLNRFGKLWVRNLMKNIPLITEAEDVAKLEGVFSGLPALLLAAGPSLDEVLPHIEEIKKRALLIAVDTAAGALISAGHAPDIMVVVDPQYWNTRHLDDAFSKPSLLRQTILISESSTHPRIFRMPVGRLFMGGSLFPLGEYLEEAAGKKKKLGAGGSVATTAWDIAVLVGSSVVYTAGLDLGFPGGKTHYSGSFFETLLHSISDRRSPFSHRSFSYVMSGDPFLHENNIGGSTLTDKRLTVYRRWFEEQMHRPDAATTINLSPEAIKIEGFEHRPLRELFELPIRRAEIERSLLTIPGVDSYELASRRKELDSRIHRLITELSSLRELAAEGLNTIESLRTALDTSLETDVSISNTSSHTHSYTHTEQRRQAYLARLERIDLLIRRSAGKDIVGFLIQPLLEEIMEGVGSVDTLKESLLQSEKIYRELITAAEYHMINLS